MLGWFLSGQPGVVSREHGRRRDVPRDCNRRPDQTSSGVKVAIDHLPSLSIWVIDPPAFVVCKEPVMGELLEKGTEVEGASGHEEWWFGGVVLRMKLVAIL